MRVGAVHKTLGGLGTHLCDLHFPLPHPDSLLQVPVADLLPDIHHHLWSSELRQLLPELPVQSQGLGPVLGGGRDQLDRGAPTAVPASWDLLAPATPPTFNVVLKITFTFSKEWVKSQDSDSLQILTCLSSSETLSAVYSLSSSLPFFLLPFLPLLRNELYF